MLLLGCAGGEAFLLPVARQDIPTGRARYSTRTLASPRSCAEAALLDSLCAIDDAPERRAELESAIRGWPSDDRRRLATDLTSAVARRAEALQQEAAEAQKQDSWSNEELKSAQSALYKFVDMTVGIQFLVKKVQDEEAGGATAG